MNGEPYGYVYPDTLANFYNPKINREAGSLAGCRAPPLNPLTLTFRHILRLFISLLRMAVVKVVGHHSLKTPSSVFDNWNGHSDLTYELKRKEKGKEYSEPRTLGPHHRPYCGDI
jgi:hypothetical protein